MSFSKGQFFLEEAEKAKKVSLLSRVFGSSVDYDHVADIYKKAANQFKLEKNTKQVREAFNRAAEAATKAGDDYTKASCLINAAYAALEIDPTNIPPELEEGAKLYVLINRPGEAGKAYKTAADSFNSINAEEEALTCLEHAVNYYNLDSFSKTTLIMTKTELAEMYARVDRYDKALELLNSLANQCINDESKSYLCKALIFKSVLVSLATGDLVASKNLLEKYSRQCSNFIKTREYSFLNELVNTVEVSLVNEFRKVIAEYDAITPINAWMMNLLVKAASALFDEE